MPESTERKRRIVVEENGPYRVEGDVPLVRKSQVVSEFGEPLTWRKDEDLEGGEMYELCRCGQSSNKPFCDRTHRIVGFDGKENAVTRPTTERQVKLADGRRIVIKRDYALCMEAGFCGNRFTDIEGMASKAEDDPQVRAQIMAMIERCPSGSYTYAPGAGEADLEPDLPQQIAVTIEMTSYGPIDGPLWVTGNIPVERADGKPFETRNRVMLCGCGLSGAKPLCDGTHRRDQEARLKQRSEQGR